jgi:hypothetical protein
MQVTIDRIQTEWQPTQMAELLIRFKPTRALWDLVTSLGTETSEAYWRMLPARQIAEPTEVDYAASALLNVDRGVEAVQLLALNMERLRRPESERRVAEALRLAAADIAIEQTDTSIFAWAVTHLLDFLERSDQADTPTLAALEFVFLPLLSYSERPARVLHRELASNPAFFVEVLSIVFRRDDEEPRELSEQDAERARLAYDLLGSWERVPGITEGKPLDDQALRTWVLAAWDGVREAHRAAIGAQYIGRILQHAPKGSDGIWPAEPVRDLIEELHDSDLEIGLELEVQNSRGVTSRGLTDGGRQEHVLAERYRGDADRLRSTSWQRTATLLRRIADDFERDARREDEEAEVRQDTWP